MTNRRSGKTYGRLIAAIARACNEKCDQLVIVDTQAAAMQAMQYIAAITAPLGDWRTMRFTDHRVDFNNGSRIMLIHKSTDPDRLRGLRFAAVWRDYEYSIPTELAEMARILTPDA